MIKFKLFNIESIKRAGLISIGAGISSFVAGVFVRSILNSIYYATDADIVRSLFYAISALQSEIELAVWIMVFVMFSNWILYPSYLNFTEAIADSLKNEDIPKFPKQFAGLQQQIQDIQKDLKLWKYHMQESENRKNELVVCLAHDIRTPLTSVIGYLELLSENSDLKKETQEKYTNIALRKADRIRQLVEELFEITRFNIGQIELRKTSFNAQVMLRQLVEEMMIQIKSRDQSVIFEMDENVVLFADSDKLARALENILNNAINYTPNNGELRIELRRKQDHICIKIENEGNEISQTELDRFFEKFYRADQARQSNTGGSGLGLAIAKNIIEAHDGTITATNSNRITTFEINLPL